MLNEILSAVILFVFVVLLVIGAVSTLLRYLRYQRLKVARPVLLGRDRDLLIGLAIPFALIAAVRAFSLQPFINDPSSGQPHLWWLLITGLPPIYALLRYDYYEIFVIERTRVVEHTETLIEKEDREVGDTRRDLQAKNDTAPK